MKHSRFDRACSNLLVLALIAYVLGARGIAGFSIGIAKGLQFFVVLAIVSFLY